MHRLFYKTLPNASIIYPIRSTRPVSIEYIFFFVTNPARMAEVKINLFWNSISLLCIDIVPHNFMCKMHEKSRSRDHFVHHLCEKWFEYKMKKSIVCMKWKVKNGLIRNKCEMNYVPQRKIVQYFLLVSWKNGCCTSFEL